MAASGRMRPLAITSPKRSAIMPEVMTFIEAGYPGVDAVTINGIVAPPGTPADYVQKLNATVHDSTVRALVSLVENDQGGYQLSVELHAKIPGMDRAATQSIMTAAHQTCPYSKALRGDAVVTLVVD